MSAMEKLVSFTWFMEMPDAPSVRMFAPVIEMLPAPLTAPDSTSMPRVLPEIFMDMFEKSGENRITMVPFGTMP